MKLVVQDFIVAENLVQELREDAVAVLKEQIAVRRGRQRDNVASACSLIAPISLDCAIDLVHSLGSAAKGDNPGVWLPRIVVSREDYFVMNSGARNAHTLVQDLGYQRSTGNHPNNRHGQ